MIILAKKKIASEERRILITLFTEIKTLNLRYTFTAATTIINPAAIVVESAAPLSPYFGIRRIQKNEVIKTPPPARIADLLGKPELLIMVARSEKSVKNPEPITNIERDSAPR